MYQINQECIIESCIIRGVYLTKKRTKKWKKQCTVFLRSPKHFNIGKHKIFSFKTKKNFFYFINMKTLYSIFVNSKGLYKIYGYIHFCDLLHRVNSVKYKVSVDILWPKIYN
jgi:hypothetical protein